MRELVLSSVNNLLLARAPSIKSGWRPIFAVFAVAGSLDGEEALSQQVNVLWFFAPRNYTCAFFI